MRVRDQELLRQYVTQKDIGYARAGRYAECSRQFIWALCNDEGKRTCSDEVGERLEELTAVLPGTLFVREGLRTARRTPARQVTDGAAA